MRVIVGLVFGGLLILFGLYMAARLITAGVCKSLKQAKKEGEQKDG